MYQYTYFQFRCIGKEGYFRALDANLCVETGDFVVDDIQICREAAKELSLDFHESKNLSYFPKGCYQSASSDSVSFNRHPNGSRGLLHLNGSKYIYAHQICEPRGRG